MGVKLNNPVSAFKLARKLGLKLSGSDVLIESVAAYNDEEQFSLCFVGEVSEVPNAGNRAIITLSKSNVEPACKIEAANPRLSFARALSLLKADPGFAFVNRDAEISPDAVVAPSAVVGKAVKIGKHTVVGHNVVIYDGVEIGDDCYIKSNSVIGEDGFGFERDENGVPFRIEHIGSVIIGDRVEIGSLNTICRGTLGNTIIEDDVKFDDHVHVAHNCFIGKRSLITACAELSGGVKVGEQCWLGPNSSFKQKIEIGGFAFVGIASNVTKNIDSRTTVAGNPARPLRTTK